MDRCGIERPSREVAIPLLRRRPDGTVPQPFLPRKGQEDEAAESRRVDRKISTQAMAHVEGPSWEQKPVGVLAIEIIWPGVTGSDALRYEPWTLATRREQRIEEKVQGSAASSCSVHRPYTWWRSVCLRRWSNCRSEQCRRHWRSDVWLQ
jgi:hypothetical protein